MRLPTTGTAWWSTRKPASQANGTAERDCAAAMFEDARKAGRLITLGADKNYDTPGFVQACRDMGVTPHVAQNLLRNRGSAIDARTTWHAGYEISQIKRKCIEQCFGWGKTIGPIRQVMCEDWTRSMLFALTMVACTSRACAAWRSCSHRRRSEKAEMTLAQPCNVACKSHGKAISASRVLNDSH